MLNMPILKFEKSTNYLNDQLDIQLNNKQLVSDIISNINLILANTSNENSANYLNIQNSANNFLQIVSQNITTIEELKREIKHITYDLTEVLSETNRKEKSKEYYIAAISSVKNNIEQYTLKFQNVEKKLEQDNIDFNDFINVNNFKYNFVSSQNNDTYEFSSFSIDNQVFSNEPIKEEETIQTKKEEKIDELTNEFKAMLSNLSEDTILNLDSVASLKNEIQNITSSQENVEEKSIQPEEDSEETDIIIGTLQDEIPAYTDIIEDSNITIEEQIVDNTASEDEIIKEDDESSNIVIDYTSIYGSYHNTAPTIEEGILNEYSSFSPIVSTNSSDTKSSEISTTIENENIEITDEDILDEILDDTSNENVLELLSNDEIDILTSEEIKSETELLENDEIKDEINDSENISNIIDEISDDDLLAELLISDDTVTEDLLIDMNSNSEDVQSEEVNPIIEKETILEEPKKVKSTKINYNNFSNYNLEEKIRIIKEASTNNDTLIISEKQNKIFLPYTIDELEKYLKSYPEVYSSLVDVVEQEFILPFNSFLNHPAKARFSETYNLIRNRQGKSIFSALIYAFKLIGRYNLNPAIIAACKTENQLDTYLYYLNSNDLGKFKLFKIIYEINPM